MSEVVDMNGVKIESGQIVKVHQEEWLRLAVVAKVFPEFHTMDKRGNWVDVNLGHGLEGMPSNILEVITISSLICNE